MHISTRQLIENLPQIINHNGNLSLHRERQKPHHVVIKYSRQDVNADHEQEPRNI